ncbi:hypothetical protein ACFVFQ_09045 [Streptomyces sp. NPDC057743]|uniref:hypothetical protein n=1 Tax=Streptomyces sp. NPDC057743 TaxID=3346236 RepID=UPI0036C1946B
MMAGLTACNGGGDKSNGTGGGSASGGSNDASGAKSPLEAALASLKTVSQQTNGKNSAKVEGTTKSGTASTTMKGAMDWSSGMHMSVDITQAGGPMGGSGKPAKALYTPDAMYMNMGMPMGGKNWIKYDYDVMAKKLGAAGALMKDMMNNNNPSRSVDLLMASGKVKQVGKEDVRGVQATHYSGTLSVSELTRMQTKNVSEADLKALEQQFQSMGATTETIDLWVSSDNLLVKKREQMASKKSPYDSTVYYSDYGTKVSVTPPPASDTTEYK